jgi:hypothetical protein
LKDGDGGEESWRFHNVIDKIVKYQQPATLNVEIQYDNELREKNFERMDAIKEAKKAVAEKTEISCGKKESGRGKKNNELKKNTHSLICPRMREHGGHGQFGVPGPLLDIVIASHPFNLYR